MNPNEIRYQLISVLLQMSEPLTLDELVAECRIEEKTVLPILKELVSKSSVVEGTLLPDKPSPQYCWAARWTSTTERRTATSKRKLTTAVQNSQTSKIGELDVDSESALAFYNHVIHEYTPPKDKRFLVFLQCSVKRPFSSSPSHASMRRAISLATGSDPRKDFERCPVHIVVLASQIGPVPYELEDVHPANVRGGGVKHFDWAYYNRVKPKLSERMAEYITVHGGNYDRMAAFTDGRYGEVMEAAKQIADVEFSVFPDLYGSRVMRIGESIPRKYWQKYWIQLYLEIIGWLRPDQKAQAEARLVGMDVKYHQV